MAPYVVLISGASRGLGKALLQQYLTKPAHIVIALNRDPVSPSSLALSDLPRGAGSRLIIIKCDASSASDSTNAAQELESQGVEHLDLVIANAGICQAWPLVRDLRIPDLEAHVMTNVSGVVWLFQAVRPLLLKAEHPKWVSLGSSAGSIRGQPRAPNSAYGPTKAAVHWLTKRMDAEEPNITAFVVDPGWVQTEMGNDSARAFGVAQAPLSIDQSVTGMGELFAVANKETHGGNMWYYDGKNLPW